jgi:hypothetical protein
MLMVVVIIMELEVVGRVVVLVVKLGELELLVKEIMVDQEQIVEEQLVVEVVAAQVLLVQELQDLVVVRVVVEVLEVDQV